MDRPTAFSVYMMATDGGPDQILCRSSMMADTKYDLSCLMFEGNCLQHRNALISKTLLLTLDRWLVKNRAQFKYYSSLAKCVHIWRAYHLKVYAAWVRFFGAVDANREAKSMVSRCISGRWGSIFDTQARLKRAGSRRLSRVLLDVAGGKVGETASGTECRMLPSITDGPVNEHYLIFGKTSFPNMPGTR
jgi:hypothetical protein